MRFDSELQPIVAQLESDAARLFGSGAVRFTLARRLEGESSRVAKLQVEGAPDVGAVYVKTYKVEEGGPSREVIAGRLRRDVEVTRTVFEHLKPVSHYVVPRVLAYFPDQLVLVTAEVRGETLSSLLEREGVWWPSRRALGDLENVLSNVGGWVRAFQQVDPPPRRFSLEDMRAYVDVRLRRLLATDPPVLDGDVRSQVLRFFDATAACVAGSDLMEVLTHSDLAPSNVMVNGHEIGVIDFAMAAPGGRYMDVARLYTQLEFLTAKPKFRPGPIRQLQRALLRGFEPDLEPDRPLFRLFVLQHLVCHMSNIARNPAPPLARLYNRHQLRLRQRWLRSFAA